MNTETKATISLMVNGVVPKNTRDKGAEMHASFSMSDLRRTAQVDGHKVAAGDLINELVPELASFLFALLSVALEDGSAPNSAAG